MFLGLFLMVGPTLMSCAASTGPNDADRTFVSKLISHHHLGMTLVDDAVKRSSDVRLRRMVLEMGNYHGRELVQLEGWVGSWSVETATAFPGRLPEADLRRLAKVTGIDHDTWWLRLMIVHHRGAIVLAEQVIAGGQHPDVRALAASVHVTQAAELAEMRLLLLEMCAEHADSAGCG
jgi:uncharacterized protein (DUF305 family)